MVDDFSKTSEAGEIKPAKDNLDMAKIQSAMQGAGIQETRRFQENAAGVENLPKIDVRAQPPGLVPHEGVHWEDRGIIDVPVADLPWPEDIHGPEDFEKITYSDAVRATNEIHNMKPLIDQGYTKEDFARLDAVNGKGSLDGQARIYNLFYGGDPITLAKNGDSYDIDNGRHRIFVAKQLGLDSIPARVKEKAVR